MTIRNIAKICHEANKALCETQGDHTQVSWSDASEEIRHSAITGVGFKLQFPDATPEDQHNSWMASKKEAGWIYGSIKNETVKEHPCMVPYNELPEEQQAKDHLFANIVTALSPFLKPEKV